MRKVVLDVMSPGRGQLWWNKARAVAGPLGPGQKYCLKIPGRLGGEYGGSNLASISLEELIDASGYIAHQSEGLPDGTKVKFRITE